MSRLDWDILGPGAQSVVTVDASKRTKLAGLSWMLFNGNTNLADVQIIADIRRFDTIAQAEGGLLLRTNDDLTNAYYLQRSISPADAYLLTKVVAGVRSDFITIPTTHAPADIVRVRFRIDGWQLSVHEFVGGAWEGIALVEDLGQSHASGHVGLFGANPQPTGSMLFDNIEIAVKT